MEQHARGRPVCLDIDDFSPTTETLLISAVVPGHIL